MQRLNASGLPDYIIKNNELSTQKLDPSLLKNEEQFFNQIGVGVQFDNQAVTELPPVMTYQKMHLGDQPPLKRNRSRQM